MSPHRGQRTTGGTRRAPPRGLIVRRAPPGSAAPDSDARDCVTEGRAGLVSGADSGMATVSVTYRCGDGEKGANIRLALCE
jgi:hypothetical protein